MSARHAREAALVWLRPWHAAKRIRSQEESIVWLLDRIVGPQLQQQEDEQPRPHLYVVKSGDAR